MQSESRSVTAANRDRCEAVRAACAWMPGLPGCTVLAVDVSHSMARPLPGRGDLRRIEAACAIAVMLREIGDTLRCFTFGEALIEVPARRGDALAQAIQNAQPCGSRRFASALTGLATIPCERLIVVTDTPAPSFAARARSLARARSFHLIDLTEWRREVGASDWDAALAWAGASGGLGAPREPFG